MLTQMVGGYVKKWPAGIQRNVSHISGTVRRRILHLLGFDSEESRVKQLTRYAINFPRLRLVYTLGFEFVFLHVCVRVCVCFPPTLNRETVKKDASWA